MRCNRSENLSRHAARCGSPSVAGRGLRATGGQPVAAAAQPCTHAGAALAPHAGAVFACLCCHCDGTDLWVDALLLGRAILALGLTQGGAGQRKQRSAVTPSLRAKRTNMAWPAASQQLVGPGCVVSLWLTCHRACAPPTLQYDSGVQFLGVVASRSTPYSCISLISSTPAGIGVVQRRRDVEDEQPLHGWCDRRLVMCRQAIIWQSSSCPRLTSSCGPSG